MKRDSKIRIAKVLMLPFFAGNPYQALLINGLVKQGITTIGSPYKWNLLHNILTQRVDVIHFHWLHQWILRSSLIKFVILCPLFFFQLVLAKFKGIKLIWTVHNLENHDKKYKRRDYIFSYVLAKLCNNVICHSTEATETAINYFHLKKDTVVTVPHGNYIDWYPNILTKEEARQALGVPLNAKMFLAFGAIRKYKNTETLIDAFKAIESVNSVLVIAGRCTDMRYKTILKGKIKESPNILVKFDHIDDKDVQLYFRATDLVVLPYTNILTSGAALLAMSFKLPIIAPELGCFAETPGKDGAILYDNNNQTNGLEEALKQVLTDKVNLESMGKYNFDLAKRLNWEYIAELTRLAYSGINKTPNRLKGSIRE